MFLWLDNIGIDHIFYGVEATNEAKGPRISYLHINICVLQDCRHQANPKDCVAHILRRSEFWEPFAVLNQVSVGLNDRSFQNGWNLNTGMRILDFKYLHQEI